MSTTEKAEKATTQVVTPTAIASYVYLSKPRKDDNGEEKWSCVLVFEKEAQQTPAFQNMRAALRAAGIAKFGEAKFAELLKNPNFKRALRSTDAEGQTQYPAGSVFVSVTRRVEHGPVQLVGPDKSLLKPEAFYSGCKVRAYLNAFGFDSRGNKGVSFGLNALQFVMDGQRLDNRKDAGEVFDTILAETPAGDLDIGL